VVAIVGISASIQRYRNCAVKNLRLGRQLRLMAQLVISIRAQHMLGDHDKANGEVVLKVSGQFSVEIPPWTPTKI
jgi:hypothetical protein